MFNNSQNPTKNPASELEENDIHQAYMVNGFSSRMKLWQREQANFKAALQRNLLTLPSMTSEGTSPENLLLHQFLSTSSTTSFETPEAREKLPTFLEDTNNNGTPNAAPVGDMIAHQTAASIPSSVVNAAIQLFMSRMATTVPSIVPLRTILPSPTPFFPNFALCQFPTLPVIVPPSTLAQFPMSPNTTDLLPPINLFGPQTRWFPGSSSRSGGFDGEQPTKRQRIQDENPGRHHDPSPFEIVMPNWPLYSPQQDNRFSMSGPLTPEQRPTPDIDDYDEMPFGDLRRTITPYQPAEATSLSRQIPSPAPEAPGFGRVLVPDPELSPVPDDHQWQEIKDYCARQEIYRVAQSSLRKRVCLETVGMLSLFNPSGPKIIPQPVQKLPQRALVLWREIMGAQYGSRYTHDFGWPELFSEERVPYERRLKQLTAEQRRQEAAGWIVVAKRMTQKRSAPSQY